MHEAVAARDKACEAPLPSTLGEAEVLQSHGAEFCAVAGEPCLVLHASASAHARLL